MTTAGNRRHQASALPFLGVALAFLITMLGTTLPTPLYPVYQSRFDFSQLTITVIFAVYALGVMGALVATGRWSDQLGRRPMLGAGLAAAAISDLIFLSSDGLSSLLVGRFISGVSAGIFTATATVAVMELAPAAWPKRAAFLATAVNMGGLGLGPILAGLLVEYLPWPLRLAYGVHLLLAVLAALAVLKAPETVTRPAQPKLTLQRLQVPEEVRDIFLPAAIAGFAGFALLGFFTATAPAFMIGVLGYDNLALSGLAAGSVFFASTIGQLLQERLSSSWRLPLGCAGVIIGASLVGIGIGRASLAFFLFGALVAGIGQGMAFRAGLGAVVQASPVDQRGGVAATFFIVAYIALSIPVVGIGLAARAFGLAPAGMAFAGGVALLAGTSLVSLVWMRHRKAQV
ncbi:Predicted arabinose efflux permease, MFS family [Onishia taeanensis]|jgi:predicted MFS family arabinose efflux permease|uniref:Predicted arabinose efflux permease, MFS family n=1 Tax=Onishia taeanensis TaxID=284577 RepID=A0A1G7RSQ8_9GAMM|nr:MFS transporter [Halomonas taeanensis]MAX32304.1 MFS transporter [Halomonadaceae bacterium]SDG13838.1 Predicted arabinose efflux permease, MFS family [Halomonas taeanensis]